MHHRQEPLYRLFYALKPSRLVAHQTDHFAQTLAPDAHRVRVDHQHVTLGITVDYADYPYAVIKALLRAGTRVSGEPFDMALDRLSLSGRSAALRPSRTVAPLKRLQADIALAMQRAGVPARPGWSFSPHQTLFYRDGRPDQRPVEGFTWRVEEFVLLCSHVGRTRHDVLGCWPLTGGGQLSLF